MKKTTAWVGIAILAGVLSACTTGPHTEASMLSGSHVMPGPKSGTMSDRVMPSRSQDCTEAALANMPADHRKACEQKQGASSAP